jgi:hypothetical protein
MTKMALQSDQAIVALLDQAAQSSAARSEPAGMGGAVDVTA